MTRRVQAQISELVASSERECTAVPHCFSTGVNLLASLHWAAAADLELCEYCMAPSPLMRHLVRRHPTPPSAPNSARSVRHCHSRHCQTGLSVVTQT